MKKLRQSMQVCYLCNQKARPGAGITDINGRRHKQCPKPSDKKSRPFPRAKQAAQGISES